MGLLLRKVIGLHACQQTLQVRPKSIKQAYLTKNWKQSSNLKEMHGLLNQHKIPIQYLNSYPIKGWQGLALDCMQRPLWNWQDIKNRQSMILVAIDSLEDPQNLGGILRSAWLFGVYGILLCKHHSVHLTPHVHKIASGGAEHVPIEIVTNLSQTLTKLKNFGFWIYGLGVPQKKTLSKAKWLWDEDFPKKLVLVVGSEGKGLHQKLEKNCDQILTIPQKDNNQSLNASTSLAVALYETNRCFAKRERPS